MDRHAIGLIDSGVGGFTVLKELQIAFPNEDFIYFGDSKNMPYGEKTNAEIISLVNSGIRFLLNKDVKLIILACNTASSQAGSEALTTSSREAVPAGVSSSPNRPIVASRFTASAISNIPAPQMMPLLIDQNRNTRSLDDLTAVRKRTMESAPTMPSEMTRLDCMARMIPAVTTEISASEMWKSLS